MFDNLIVGNDKLTETCPEIEVRCLKCVSLDEGNQLRVSSVRNHASLGCVRKDTPDRMCDQSEVGSSKVTMHRKRMRGVNPSVQGSSQFCEIRILHSRRSLAKGRGVSGRFCRVRAIDVGRSLIAIRISCSGMQCVNARARFTRRCRRSCRGSDLDRSLEVSRDIKVGGTASSREQRRVVVTKFIEHAVVLGFGACERPQSAAETISEIARAKGDA